MIGLLLVVQMSHARDVRRVSLFFRPGHRSFLCRVRVKNMFGVVFDDVIIYGRAFRSALGSRLYENVSHLVTLSFLLLPSAP